MLGSFMALESVRRHMEEERRKEQRRKKWVEKVEGVERIFVNCECCGRPYAREQVIHVPAADIEQWKAASAEHSDTYGREFRRLRNVVFLLAIAGGFIGYYVGLGLKYEGDWLFYAVAAGVLVGTVASLFLEKSTSQRFDTARQKAAQTQKDILTRAGMDVDPGKVSTGDDVRKYLLMARE